MLKNRNFQIYRLFDDLLEKKIWVIIFFALFFAIFKSTRVLKELYFIALFLNLFIILYGLKKNSNSSYHKKSFLLLLVFGVYITITAFWSSNPPYTIFRALFFLYIAFAAFFSGFILTRKKEYMYEILFYLNLVFLVGALISLISGIPHDAWTANHGRGFMAFMAHQNTFAALLLFTSLGPVMKFTEIWIGNKSNVQVNKNMFESGKKKRILIYSLIILMNLYFIIVSHSRTSVITFLGFIGIVIFVVLQNKSRKVFVISILALLFLLYVVPTFNRTITTYFQKGFDNYLATRLILWEPSYTAAQHGGFLGLGYGISDPEIVNNYTKPNMLGITVREKGNSVLALIEEVGIVGLFIFSGLFLIFFYNNFKRILNLYKKNVQRKSIYFTELIILTSYVIALLIHSQFEAWWVWVGSIYLQIFLMLISFVPTEEPLLLK